MSEEGRKRLKELAQQIRAQAAKSDEQRHKKGLLLIELMARDLTGDEGMPGLKLWRDAPSKFRAQRGTKNNEIALEWQREIGAAVLTCTRFGEPAKTTRYILDEEADVWRRMDESGPTGDIYEDIAAALVDYLYPEAKKK